jgi:predicted RNase H-like HicB family nuclease
LSEGYLLYALLTKLSCVIKRYDGTLIGAAAMEHIIQIHIEKLPDGGYLATSEDVQGLVAQGRTIQETVEIARDVTKKLIEAQSTTAPVSLPPVREVFDYPLIVAT